MESLPQPLAELVNALVARDFDRLAGSFAPDVRLGAALPGEVAEAATPAAAAGLFRDWYGDAEELHMLSSASERLGRTTTFAFRLRVLKPRGWSVIAKAGACELAGGKVLSLRLACTGFQYEEAGPANVFDAGDLGCGSGLPAAFRERIDGVAVGQQLEVIARDPSARQDLPALARMLGHRVLSIETGHDGTIVFQVERGR